MNGEHSAPHGLSRGVTTALGVLAGIVVGLALAWFLPALPFGDRAPDAHSAPGASAAAPADDSLWSCGMHPQVLENEPGSCPICGMDLTPVDAGPGHDHTGHDHGPEAALWTCPMHPEVLTEEPGDCPICGMDLVEVETDGTAEPGSSADGEPRGSSVIIDPRVVQNMNVKTAPVTMRELGRPIRTLGSLDFDQERMVTVTTKYSGWVEEVHVNNLGERIRRGQPLFEIYSPELVQTKQELLSALEYANEMQDAPADIRRRAESLVESARTRLSYWDLSTEQIERLIETREVGRSLTVTAPASGLVMKRMPGLEGMAIRPGMEIFHLADLSSLWLTVEVFEDQIAWVREGTQASIELSYFPGEMFRGVVRYLEPELSEATRTLRVKIEVPNTGGRLRKGMYATVLLEPPPAAATVAVPSQAVLRTGRREVVVIAEGDGAFTPREVVTGRTAEGYTEILDGAVVGETVVTSAQFLLDSESRLRDAVQMMIAERRARRTEG